MSNQFRVNRPSEELLEIWLDEKFVGCYDEDRDGNHAMEKAVRMIKAISKILNIPVIETAEEE